MGRVAILNSTGTAVIYPATNDTLESIVTLLGTTGIKVNGLVFDGDVELGEVQLNNAAGTTINPATAENQAAQVQAANSVWANGDLVTPAGAVRKDTRALPEAVADGDWTALQTTATGELRVRDDDNITAQASLLAAVEPFSSATPITYTFDAENLAGGSVTAGIPSRKVLLCPAANNTGLVYYGPTNEWINIPVDGPMLISADNPADVKIKGTVVGDVVYVIVYN